MIIEKIQEFIKSRELDEKNIYIVLLIVVVAFLSFGLGKLSALDVSKYPVRIEGIHETIQQEEVEGSGRTLNEGISQGGLLVGSKNSTKYHHPWCAGAQRIKEENKVWFSSPEEAQSLGYSPASNCPGL